MAQHSGDLGVDEIEDNRVTLGFTEAGEARPDRRCRADRADRAGPRGASSGPDQPAQQCRNRVGSRPGTQAREVERGRGQDRAVERP